MLIATTSCDTVDDPMVSWSGEFIQFGEDEPNLLCSGTLSRDDQFVSSFTQLFGIDDVDTIYYYRYTEKGFEETPCPKGSLGCYWDGRVYSIFVPNRNELVHAVLQGAGIEPHPFLDEGFAELFSDVDRQPNGFSVEDGLSYTGSRSEFPSELRWRAGHFAAFLMSLFSPNQLKTLLSETCIGDDFDELSGKFSRVLSVDFDALLSQYNSVQICSSRTYTKKIVECSEPAIECTANSCILEQSFSCDDPETVGPRASYVWAVRTLRVEGEGELEASVVGGGVSAGAVIGRCDSFCDSSAIDIRSSSNGVLWASSGLYYVRPYSNVDADDSNFVEVSINIP